jgi:hypothetical protein
MKSPVPAPTILESPTRSWTLGSCGYWISRESEGRDKGVGRWESACVLAARGRQMRVVAGGEEAVRTVGSMGLLFGLSCKVAVRRTGVGWSVTGEVGEVLGMRELSLRILSIKVGVLSQHV